MKAASLLLLAGLLPAPAAAQADSLRISVVTMGPGAQVWERFGHNAIMVEDLRTGGARWYDYGRFDFGGEDFWPRFLAGRMRYWTADAPAGAAFAAYRAANRSVWVQELALDAEQRRAMRDFLEWNVRPENRYYDYDYFRDNCSTRVRDALDRVVGGAVRAATESVPSGTTYRFHVRRLTAAAPLIYTGVEFGLGRPTDVPVSAWEEMWLPLAVRAHLREVRVRAADGTTRPLVAREYTLFESTAPPPPATPPVRWPWYALLGIVAGGTLALAGRRAAAGTAARRLFVWAGVTWSLLAGVAGVLLAFLWGFTGHTAAHANENLLQFSPFSLGLAVLLPRAARTLRARHRATGRLALALVVLSAAGLLLKLLPGVSQMNLEAIALALPVHAGLLLGLARR